MLYAVVDAWLLTQTMLRNYKPVVFYDRLVTK